LKRGGIEEAEEGKSIWQVRRFGNLPWFFSVSPRPRGEILLFSIFGSFWQFSAILAILSG
jgi:hypothetical protein